MRATLHPDAESDIAEAAAFYEKEGSATLAARFVAEVKRVINVLLRDPEIGTPRANGRRFFPTKVFPYGLIYRRVPEGIYILAVKRHRRRPKFGTHRSAPKRGA